MKSWETQAPVEGLCTDGRSKEWGEELVDCGQGWGHMVKALEKSRGLTRAVALL